MSLYCECGNTIEEEVLSPKSKRKPKEQTMCEECQEIARQARREARKSLNASRGDTGDRKMDHYSNGNGML